MDRFNFQKINKIKWLSRWAGSYTFISCSFWGPQYYNSLKDNLGIGFQHVLFLHNKGTVKFYVADQEFRRFGKSLAEKSIKDIDVVRKLCRRLKKNTDIILPIMKRISIRIPTWQEYKNFLKYFDRHLAYHNFIKKTVDFIDAKSLTRLLPLFNDARKYSESVYSDSEKMFRSLAKIIAKEKKYPARILTCLTQKELGKFLVNKELPDKEILSDRYDNSVLYFENGREIILTGAGAKRADSLITKQGKQNTDKLKGVSVYPGKIKGVARVILDPHKKQIFNQGNILVTGMTRPEFMLYISKASAIITDVGGVLCHAAITARELKIPCIVGAVNATKILKNGQQIFVDADKGIIHL